MEGLLTLLFIIVGTSIIWVPALIIYFIYKYTKRNSNDRMVDQNTEATSNQARDKQWTDYLTNFQAVVTSAKEKALLQALISGISSDEFAGKTKPVMAASNVETNGSSLTQDPAQPQFFQSLNTPTTVREPAPQREPIDNTLLLLYFGAFLLVASVGLFVAISGLAGTVRTIIVGLTSAVLYLGGLQLYSGSKKLAAAGISFVGTGMIIAPLTGVTYYNLVTDKTGGGLIWLVTSLACIGLFVYAYQRIKNDFTAYLLIGSFVSTIESSVLTIGLPTYGYAWGLVAVGLVLLLSSRKKAVPTILDRSSATSATLLVPLSLLGSIFLLPEFGNIQLAITLVLAGVYYGLLSVWELTDQRQHRMVAQGMFLSAIVNLVYAVEPSYVTVGVTLTIIAAVYAFVIAGAKNETVTNFGLIELAATVSGLALVFSISSPWAVVGSLVVSAFLATIIWLANRSDESLQIAGAILLTLPFVVGLYALKLELDSLNQLYLASLSGILLFILTTITMLRPNFKEYYNTATVLFWTGVAAVLTPALLIGSGEVIAVVVANMLACLVFRKLSGDATWLLGSSVISFIPLIYAAIDQGFDSPLFSWSILAALVWNIAVSLKTRQAAVRWFVVTLILLAPVALGEGGFGFEWESFGYSFGYILAMLSCVLARAIARGQLLVSFKVPIASYYTYASQAYVAGYILAGIIALCLSLDTVDSRLITTSILGIIAVVTLLIARIERDMTILALLPVLLQLATFSAIRPDLANGTQVGITAVLLTGAGALSYWLPLILADGKSKAALVIKQVSLVTAYLGPALALISADHSRLLPLSLFSAGLLTFHYFYQTAQQYRELSLAVCIASVNWLVYLYGVTNIHIHSHILAGFLAIFAVWRYSRGERSAYDTYIQAIFLVVTIPLIFSSLYNEAGGVYGLILIGEQVMFMLAGVTLPASQSGQRFLLRWGLWTALAAILFQLRGLGYAFLSLLAIIVIGVAVYRLQKTDNK